MKKLFLILALLSIPSFCFAAEQAKRVSIADAGDYFAGTDVESALQELGASAGHDAVTLAASADTLLCLTGQALSLDTQTANYVFAGPTSGAAAVPTFRALVADDIPDLSSVYWTVGNAFITLTGLSATNPIVYNNTTGAITWTNSEGYLTAVPANDLYEVIVFNFKSFGQTIAAGTTLTRTIPYAGTITGWEIFSSSSGSMVCTINKSITSSPNAPSWAAISGTEKPTLSTAVRNTDTSLSSWTTAVAAGNQIQCSVDATPDITGTVTVVIYITKT